MKRDSGYTILELVIATTLLLMLGIGLTALLEEGLRTWHRGRTATTRAGVAQFVLGRIAEDLRCLEPAAATDRSAALRFEASPDGSAVLVLVRRLPGDSLSAATRQAGNFLLPDAFIDGRDDATEAANGRLAASGGLMEVVYLRDAAGTVSRGFRSPPAEDGWSTGKAPDPAGLAVLAREVLGLDVAPHDPLLEKPWSGSWQASSGKAGALADLPPAVRVRLVLEGREPTAARSAQGSAEDAYTVIVPLPCAGEALK